MYKKIMLSSIVILVSLLAGCNGGGGGGNDPVPQPTPFTPLNLAYTYTVNYTTGELESGLPVADMRPFGQQVKVTYTVTNPYESMPIWFRADGYLTSSLIESNFSQQPSDASYTGYKFVISNDYSGSTCLNYTSSSTPLPSKQSCTIVMTILGQYNYTNNELINIAPPNKFSSSGLMITYYFPSKIVNGSEVNRSTTGINTWIRAGIWYQNQLGYSLGQTSSNWLTSFHAINESGVDYLYLTENVQGPKVKVTFDSNNIAQVDLANNTVPCILNGCVSGLIPTDGYNINPYYNGTGAIMSGGNPSNGSNNAILGLDQVQYARSGSLSKPFAPVIFAVQSDGTIVGQNTSGQYGCFNNDGTNFRSLQLPESVTFVASGFTVGLDVADTISYGNTNWIAAVYKNDLNNLNYYKVLANISGSCTLDSTNVIFNGGALYSIRYGMGGVSQQMQITPNGIYSVQPNSYQLQYYKYPPRQ